MIGRAWTKEDDALLRQWKAEGASNVWIGTKLGRGENAVRAHWSDLNRSDRMRSPLSARRHDPRVPDHVWAERDARMSAPISIGGFVLGDPPRGHSALERRK
jgi:hypothetical protein